MRFARAGPRDWTRRLLSPDRYGGARRRLAGLLRHSAEIFAFGRRDARSHREGKDIASRLRRAGGLGPARVHLVKGIGARSSRSPTQILAGNTDTGQRSSPDGSAPPPRSGRPCSAGSARTRLDSASLRRPIWRTRNILSAYDFAVASLPGRLRKPRPDHIENSSSADSPRAASL